MAVHSGSKYSIKISARNKVKQLLLNLGEPNNFLVKEITSIFLDSSISGEVNLILIFAITGGNHPHRDEGFLYSDGDFKLPVKIEKLNSIIVGEKGVITTSSDSIAIKGTIKYIDSIKWIEDLHCITKCIDIKSGLIHLS